MNIPHFDHTHPSDYDVRSCTLVTPKTAKRLRTLRRAAAKAGNQVEVDRIEACLGRLAGM
jgi:hypothetical protein